MSNNFTATSPILAPSQASADFLESLFRPATPDSYLEIRPLPDKKGRNRQWHRIRDLRQHGFAQALPAHLDGITNVYSGVCPRVRRGGTGADVSQGVAVWFDEITRPAPDLPPLSWLVETSPAKVQGGYFLDRACHDLDRVERVTRRLGNYVGGDHVWNRDRILRLPGFINCKYPSNPRSVLVEFHPDRRYSLDELERMIPAIERDANGEGCPTRQREGPFNPHAGRPLSPDGQSELMGHIGKWGLHRYSDGRYAGACPFPHVNGPCECESAFYISPITGQWWCFCSDHPGQDGRGGAL